MYAVAGILVEKLVSNVMTNILEILPQELNDMNKQEYQLIDVREKWEKDLADLGGLLIPLHGLANYVHGQDFCKNKLIVYCHHGFRSLIAVKYLRSIGIDNSFSLSGGIDRWSCEIDNDIPRYN